MEFTTDFTTPSANHSTTAAPVAAMQPIYGFIGVAAAAICFSVNYLPVKRYNTGDGMFFQWILCTAILVGGFIVSAIRQFPPFDALVMVGGVLWATGNVCVVPIINMIGLGLGMLLWGSTSIVFGWLSARFGWFGIDKQLPANYAMNYIGFCFTALSPILYSFVKTEAQAVPLSKNTSEVTFITTDDNESRAAAFPSTDDELITINNPARTKKYANLKRRLLGVGMSIFAGILYGLMFIPVTYVKNRHHGASQSDIDHMLPQCFGIYLTSSLFFFIYCFVKRNRPEIQPDVVLPGLLCGGLWFIAYVGYFVANEAIRPLISQPIISALPGLISLIIVTIVYREVKGRKNYIIVAIAFTTTLTGVILTGLSKF